MIANLKKTKFAGHILDGPQGPAGVVKAGVIHLAHETDAVIVPLSVSAEKAWYFNSWDKFFVPKPFSRVSIRFGDLLKFDKVEDENSFEKQRKLLEEIMPPPLEP
jgi:lysophospholipid acyltransferase (LPLAT)-like uncharacterized protein